MRRAAFALLLGALLTEPTVAASLDALDQDGWYTWRVAAAEGVPAWCCFTRHRGTAKPRVCNLDDRGSYGSCDDAVAVNGFVQLYAKIESGDALKLRVLSPGCPVESAEGVSDLGEVDVEESFNWLKAVLASDSPAADEALMAIAMHRGEAPLRFLTDAANGAAEGDVREDAIFWLGQVRIAEAAGTIERLMFSDDSPDIRQHAAFVLAQSEAPSRTEALIRQGREDRDGETRAEAWFWLAQTGASASEEAILRAISADPDPEVREEAVFALSQLPEERAVEALIAVLENRRVHRKLREEALFWLAQSDSDRGLAVVERLLTGGEAVRN